MFIWLKVAAAVLLLAAGWHAHTIYDAYKLEKAQTKAIKKLGKGQNEIIKFNQAFDKALGTDDCGNKPIPDALRLLLE